MTELRIRRNDFGALQPAALGDLRPTLRVSVVIPAYGGRDKLDLTLASLAAQSYPQDLMEVIVVDDGGDPAVRIPELAPANTQVVPSAPGGWGRAWACQSGYDHATGDVIVTMDADLVLFRHHIEAQLRWHHLADYLVVTGWPTFADISGGLPTPRAAHAAVLAGHEDALLPATGEDQSHRWLETILKDNDGLRRAPSSLLYRTHVGGTVSASAALLRAAGGMDTDLVLGEDTELGFRLTQQGAVFIPDRAAACWHLGPTTAMNRLDEVRRFNTPFIADRVPYRRWVRTEPGRQWLVPYVDVVVDARGRGYEEVRDTVDSALASTLADVRVTVVGAWSELTGERRRPLDDPLLDLRLLQVNYRHESRVRLLEREPVTSAPVPFRFRCPAGWSVGSDTLKTLVRYAEEHDSGVMCLALAEEPGGVVAARLERTSAMARASRLAERGGDLDDVVAEIFDVTWHDGPEWKMLPPGKMYPRHENSRDREAAYWRAEALAHQRAAERLRGRVQQLKDQYAALKRDAGKNERDAERWKIKAEELRVKAVRWERLAKRTIRQRATSALRRLI